MHSVKLDVASVLCSDLASLIRTKISRLPHLEELVSDYDEIHDNNVSIYNKMWNARGLRKLHIERAITSKGIEILHCVLFPDPEFPIPIFGCDIVEAGGKVTAAIVDISPVYKVDYSLSNLIFSAALRQCVVTASLSSSNLVTLTPKDLVTQQFFLFV